MKGTRKRGAVRTSSVLLAAGLLAGTVSAASAAGPASVSASSQASASADATVSLRAPLAPCRSSQLVADSAERAGATQVRVTVTNDGPRACELRGFPTVALAGQGSPDRNKPLDVRRQGMARTVRLPVGGTATTQLTFTPVLGEADGYCASGADPVVAPSIVVGVGGGQLQLGVADGGDFALCGNSVRATAFR
ncbi:Tat pathway signal sequence domain protein [Streptomyces venezuelae]|uniref:Tat pathway signal sequence domain protein n=1 Tax=Streptomyces venezuelae TaxID=54571 RepID=A0A5P2D1H9_STRVZ|nr:DUF4232 domain-containing protein [Streptomyces venezuelae]QES47898.1 Tat pathway signal sequence domain protein [Streptomyces venezuelae]